MGSRATPPPEKRRIPRKHPRVRLVTQVEATSLGRTENVSVGGVLVVTRETFEANTRVVVRFNLPPDRSIEALGVVMHSLPQVSMGIKFLQLKDDDRKAIEEFIRQTGEESNSRESSEPGFPFCLPLMARLYTRSPPIAQKLRSSHNRSASKAFI